MTNQAKLKITRANGEVSEHKITPGVEYAFELKYGSGISKVLREHERQTEIFWLAYECLRRAGAQIPLWGVEFIDMDSEMYGAIIQVLTDRAKEIRNASRSKRR